MALRVEGEIASPYRGEYDGVPYKMFELAALSNTSGILDPNTALDVTARGLMSLVDGTVEIVDIYGNVTTPPIIAGIPLIGKINAVKSTNTTISASQIIVLL